jgi:16S rRNA C967 or C1407 C5-methylase (RsmB/RsmF family)
LHARYLCKKLRSQFPELRIVAAVVVRDEARDVRTRELQVSATEVASSLSEAAQRVQSLVPVRPAPAPQSAVSS